MEVGASLLNWSARLPPADTRLALNCHGLTNNLTSCSSSARTCSCFKRVVNAVVVSLNILNNLIMSVLGRYTKSIDGTIPVSALLYDDERLLASQDGVGLYDG